MELVKYVFDILDRLDGNRILQSQSEISRPNRAKIDVVGMSPAAGDSFW